MDDLRKVAILDSFPATFEQIELGISISMNEFKVFEDGVYAQSMDEKWNVFVVDNVLIFARSWTDACIYKVYTERRIDMVVLKYYRVNRDRAQYNNNDIDFDDRVVKRLIQGYLRRDDIYADPRQKIELIKQTIEREDPYNKCLRSTGSQAISITRFIYNSLSAQTEFYEIHGWEELKRNIADKDGDEHLVSLYMQSKESKGAKTFYFNNEGTELLGEIIIHTKNLASILGE